MNFLEAVQALSDGRCKGITRPMLSGYARLNDDISTKDYDYSAYGVTSALVWITGNSPSYLSTFGIENYLATDWQLVDETPQFEEVEVVRWYCTSCKNSQGMEGTNLCCELPMVKLTDTYRRPVRRKVLRREEIHRPNIGDIYVNASEIVPPTAKFFAEWEE